MRTLAIFAAILSFYMAPAYAQVDYEALKHVDLRDLAAQPTYLHTTSQYILALMEANEAAFVGPVGADGKPDRTAQTGVVYYASGAKGPIGDKVQGSDGKNYWQLNSADDPKQQARIATRKNTIFSAEFEEIEEEIVNVKFKLKMVLFVHDPRNPNAVVSNGYYFRRLWILVDYSGAAKEPDIQILSAEQDIPLNATQFQISGDIFDRKIVLEDAVYGITKVFPVGVGSFNIRTGRNMDGSVKSMTREFGVGSHLTPVGQGMADGPGSNNTRQRTYPWYYRGRPFLGIIAEDGNYKSIGFHWQIDADGLQRGFVSHGCIRTLDKDLYQMDAILNEGGRPIPVIMKNSLGGRFATMTHPYPHRTEDYWAAVYSAVETADHIQCRFNTYDVIRDKRNPKIHTIADPDCLTMTVKITGDPQPIVDYLLSGINPPKGPYAGGLNHAVVDLEGGDASSLECYGSDGGEEDRQQTRNDVQKFFDGIGKGFGNLFNGNAFKSRKQRLAEQQACDQKIRLIPADPGTPLQKPVQVFIPAELGAVNRGSAAPITPATSVSPDDGFIVTQQSGGGELSDVEQAPDNMVRSAPVVNKPVVTNDQAMDQSQLTEVERALLTANDKINELSNYMVEYCSPRARAGYESYCAKWNSQITEWQNYRAQLQQIQHQQ
jgi:hypothetical protein